ARRVVLAPAGGGDGRGGPGGPDRHGQGEATAGQPPPSSGSGLVNHRASRGQRGHGRETPERRGAVVPIRGGCRRPSRLAPRRWRTGSPTAGRPTPAAGAGAG